MTKKDDAKSLLELMPTPTQEDVNKIAKKVGCSERTVYRALEDLRLTQDSQSDTNNVKKKIPKSTNKNPPQEPSYIDDPDELLLSVAIRELNKKNPDPRWASILINCKKEKITIQGDAVDQFKNLPTQALVNILSKSLQEEY